MSTSGTGLTSTSVTWTGSSVAVRMCHTVLLMTLLFVNIHVSSQAPPRLSSCRNIHKAKEPSIYSFTTQATCGGVEVPLPVRDSQSINITDIRNCANYFVCRGSVCQQCPCADGMTFNPATLKCEVNSSPCICPTTTSATTRNTATTTIVVVPEKTESTTTVTTKKPLLIRDAGTGKQNGENSNNPSENKAVSTEVIIIAAIVSATVIVIVIIVMAVFCWQRRHATSQIERMNKPSPGKLSSVNHDGYSTSMPPSEKHEYAEIDERMITTRHWQHSGGSMKPPPIPDHQPPNSALPPNTGFCPHHHHQQQHMRADSGLGSADTSFTSNYPKRTFQPIDPASSIRIGVSYNERDPNNHYCGDEMYHGRECSSISTDSHYSHSSNPTSVESHDIDMKTPLAKQNYVSKQVYI